MGKASSTGTPCVSRGPERLREGDMRHEHMSAWTPEEDMLILQLFASEGRKWGKIAGVLKGRSSASVRNRYLRIEKGVNCEKRASQRTVARRAGSTSWGMCALSRRPALLLSHALRASQCKHYARRRR